MMLSLQEGEIPTIRVSGTYAVVAITKHGVEMARTLQGSLGQAVDV